MPSTTPEPSYTAPNTHNVAPDNRVEVMQYPVKARYRAAAMRARKSITFDQFPAIAELVQRELLAFEEFGWIPGSESLAARLLAEVEKLPCEATIAAQSSVRGGFAAKTVAK